MVMPMRNLRPLDKEPLPHHKALPLPPLSETPNARFRPGLRPGSGRDVVDAGQRFPTELMMTWESCEGKEPMHAGKALWHVWMGKDIRLLAPQNLPAYRLQLLCIHQREGKVL